jgi:hypothetical protein
MSQRVSGYVRAKDDAYMTPAWCTLAVCPHIEKRAKYIWEPACGSGKMESALLSYGFRVAATDIATGNDFLDYVNISNDAWIQAIVTNPPFSRAEDFIVQALALMKPQQGLVAMLLRCDYDHAKTRRYLFGDCKAFAKKLVLTRRIRWIEGSTGSPSFNHAWFIWDYQHRGPPELAYYYED